MSETDSPRDIIDRLLQSAAHTRANTDPHTQTRLSVRGTDTDRHKGECVDVCEGEEASVEELMHAYTQLCRETWDADQELQDRVREIEDGYAAVMDRRVRIEERDRDIERMQQQIIDMNVALIDEKWDNLDLQGELQKLRIDLLHEEKKCELVSSLDHGPQTRTQGVLYRDCRPESDRTDRPKCHKMAWVEGCPVHTFPHAYDKKCSACMALRRGKAGIGQSPASAAELSPQMAKRRVLRTVYFPNARADRVIKNIHELSRRLEELKRVSLEQMQMMTEDLLSQKAEHSHTERIHTSHIGVLTHDTRTLERDLLQMVKDHYDDTHAMCDTRVQRAEASLRHAHDVCAIAHHTHDIRTEVQDLSLSITTRSDVYHTNLNTLIRESENGLTLLKEQHTALESVFKERIERLESRVDAMRTQRKQAARRAHMDLEGLARDLLELQRDVDATMKALGPDASDFLYRHRRMHADTQTNGHAHTLVLPTATQAQSPHIGFKKLNLAGRLGQRSVSVSPTELTGELERLTHVTHTLMCYLGLSQGQQVSEHPLEGDDTN